MMAPLEHGDHMPVVLAPGLLCDASLWDGLRPLLHGTVWEVDFRTDATLEAMAERILACTPKRFVLAGFSMGGMAAIVAARRAPQRIAGLVVLSTHGAYDDAERRQARLDQIERADREPFEAFAASLPGLYFSDPRANPAAAHQVQAMALKQGATVFKRHVQAVIERPDIGALAKGLAMRATFMNGADDKIAPPVLGRHLAGCAPHGRFVALTECGHMAPLERPEPIAAAINAYTAAMQQESAG